MNTQNQKETKQKSVLIAGATGYLGRYAVKAFKDAGYKVKVLVRNEQKLSQPGVGLAPAIRADVDEIHVGDVTQPNTLKGICDGVDVVFSSISLMGQKGSQSWHEVDYLGNMHILHEALASHVQKFIFVSVFNAEKLPNIPIVKAHEDFAIELAKSGLAYAVVRPTGYFSDLSAFLPMAQSGRIYLLGNGEERMNPIHGADLAQICVDAVQGTATDIDAGGPQTYSWNELANLAFNATNKTKKITHLPLPLARTGVKIMRIINRQTADLWDFFVSSAALSHVAPTFGTHYLDQHYLDLAKQES